MTRSALLDQLNILLDQWKAELDLLDSSAMGAGTHARIRYENQTRWIRRKLKGGPARIRSHRKRGREFVERA